jgi:hypothetical protein
MTETRDKHPTFVSVCAFSPARELDVFSLQKMGGLNTGAHWQPLPPLSSISEVSELQAGFRSLEGTQ